MVDVVIHCSQGQEFVCESILPDCIQGYGDGVYLVSVGQFSNHYEGVFNDYKEDCNSTWVYELRGNSLNKITKMPVFEGGVIDSYSKVVEQLSKKPTEILSLLRENILTLKVVRSSLDKRNQEKKMERERLRSACSYFRKQDKKLQEKMLTVHNASKQQAALAKISAGLLDYQERELTVEVENLTIEREKLKRSCEYYKNQLKSLKGSRRVVDDLIKEGVKEVKKLNAQKATIITNKLRIFLRKFIK